MENWHRTGHVWKSLQFPPFWRTHCTSYMDTIESWLFIEYPILGTQNDQSIWYFLAIWWTSRLLFPPNFVDPTSAHFSYVVKSPIQILIFLGQIWHVAQSPSFSWSNHIKSISVSKSNQPFCHAPPPFSARPRCHAAAHGPHSLYEVALLVQLRGEFHRVVRHDTHLLRWCDQMINGLVLLGKSTGNHGFYMFLPSNIGLSCKFSHHPILWDDDQMMIRAELAELAEKALLEKKSEFGVTGIWVRCEFFRKHLGNWMRKGYESEIFIENLSLTQLDLNVGIRNGILMDGNDWSTEGWVVRNQPRMPCLTGEKNEPTRNRGSLICWGKTGNINWY